MVGLVDVVGAAGAVAVVDVAMNKSVYCDLVIYSDLCSNLPDGLFLAKAKTKITYTDNLSADRVAQRLRWEKAGIPMRSTVARHWWEFSSEHKVAGDDLEKHIGWLLSHLRYRKLLKAELTEQYRYYLSVFWGASNGTGGGPVVSCSLAQTLAEHALRMDIGFYVSE
jgi:hypothetical protein